MHKQTGASPATSLDAIAEALRTDFANSGETYTSLATKTGYSRQSLKRWLGKRHDLLTLRSIIRITNALGAETTALSAEAHS